MRSCASAYERSSSVSRFSKPAMTAVGYRRAGSSGRSRSPRAAAASAAGEPPALRRRRPLDAQRCTRSLRRAADRDDDPGTSRLPAGPAAGDADLAVDPDLAGVRAEVDRAAAAAAPEALAGLRDTAYAAGPVAA